MEVNRWVAARAYAPTVTQASDYIPFLLSLGLEDRRMLAAAC